MFKMGEKALKFNVCIKKAKTTYAQKVQEHFKSNDLQQLWRAIKTITDYNKKSLPVCTKDASFLHALNDFYAQFETSNPSMWRRATFSLHNRALSVTTMDVRKTVLKINPRKTVGPDNIPRRVLKEKAHELTEVFTDIFNISFAQTVVPTCFKNTTIIPRPEKSPATCFNDYCPKVLTTIIMKCLHTVKSCHVIQPWFQKSGYAV